MTALPRVDVVLPVFDEATTIATKLANLAALTYPRERLHVVLVDGGSSDATIAAARSAARHWRLPVDVVEVPLASKPAQLNAGWRSGNAPYVLVTDADAKLPPSILDRLVAAAEADGGCALVGAALEPASPVVLERVYWHCANRLRALEERWLGSSGLVVGPCYLARRSSLVTFGDDVVSDDAHISLSVLARGFRVAYIDAAVTELRGPATWREFLRHKRRKAAAYLGEVFRVMSQRHGVAPTQRRVILLRLLLLTTLPWLLALLGAWALWVRPAHVVAGAAVSLCAAVLRASFKSYPWPAFAGGVALVALPWIVAATLIVAMVAYPFSRQSPSYPKVTLFADPEV